MIKGILNSKKYIALPKKFIKKFDCLSKDSLNPPLLPLPKRKIKLNKIKRKQDSNKYTIYYQDNRETMVVNINNKVPTCLPKAKLGEEYTTTKTRMNELKTPYFGETRNKGGSFLHSQSLKTINNDTVRNLGNEFTSFDK